MQDLSCGASAKALSLQLALEAEFVIDHFELKGVNRVVVKSSRSAEVGPGQGVKARRGPRTGGGHAGQSSAGPCLQFSSG